jgi:hypothetical protein
LLTFGCRRALRVRRIGPSLLLIAWTARAAFGHIVPIPPSECRFDPLDLQVPTMGLTGAARPAEAADTMRILYDVSVNQLQFCAEAAGDPGRCGDPVPRPFTLGPTTGTLTLPSLFIGTMELSGDVVIADLPIAFTLGAATATVPVTLTTGLVAVNGSVAEGTPLQGLGSLVLVGTAPGDALPPPITGQPLLVRMSCQPRPVPDKDQFATPPRITSIKGWITTGRAKLRATVELPSSTAPDFAGRPTLLAVHVDGVTVASAVLSGGLHGRRRLAGASDDRHAKVDVRQRSAARLALAMVLRSVALPPQASGARVLVDLAVDTGGLLGRGEQLFHASRNGRRLRPE